MKKLIFITMTIIAIMTTSCSKTEDFSDPKNLVGTTWRCSNFTNADEANTYDYYELNFVSTTQVEEWDKKKNANATKEEAYSYSINGNAITLSIDAASFKSVGTIDKKTMSFTANGNTFVFTKQ